MESKMEDISWLNLLRKMGEEQTPYTGVARVALSAWKEADDFNRSLKEGRISDYKSLDKRTRKVLDSINKFFLVLDYNVGNSQRISQSSSFEEIKSSTDEISVRLEDISRERILTRASIEKLNSGLDYVSKDLQLLQESVEDVKYAPPQIIESTRSIQKIVKTFSDSLQEFARNEIVQARPSDLKMFLPLAVAPFVLLLFLFNSYPQTGMYVFSPGDNLPSVIALMMISIIFLFYFFGYMGRSEKPQ